MDFFLLFSSAALPRFFLLFFSLFLFSIFLMPLIIEKKKKSFTNGLLQMMYFGLDVEMEI